MQTFISKIVEQITSNLYSMILETVIMLLIAGYAIYEIREMRSEISDIVNASHEALAVFSKEQGVKLEAITEEITRTTSILAGAVGITVEDYKENRSEIYKKIQDGGKNALQDYLKAKFQSKPKEEPEEE